MVRYYGRYAADFHAGQLPSRRLPDMSLGVDHMSELWQRLRQRDFHLHTRFSDGAGKPQELLQACRAVGLKRIAVTDHCEYAHPYSILDRWDEYVHTMRQLQADAQKQGIELLIGIETGVDIHGNLKAPSYVLEQAELIIASVHQVNLRPDESPTSISQEVYWQRYREQILMAAACPQVDVIGHIEGYLVTDWEQLAADTFEKRRQLEKELVKEIFPLSWYKEVARTAAQNGVAVELHGLSQSPRPEVVEVLKAGGVKLSIGSDAHALHHVAYYDYIEALVAQLHLHADDFAAFVGL
jgi:HisJ family histidinol phosphate phosphatase